MSRKQHPDWHPDWHPELSAQPRDSDTCPALFMPAHVHLNRRCCLCLTHRPRSVGHTWNGEHNLKSPSPQGNSLFTKKVFSQALNQLLLALLERGGRLVAACPPRQCWPPPKPTKVSGNLPRESSQGIFPPSPAGFWMKPQEKGVQRVSVPSMSLLL